MKKPLVIAGNGLSLRKIDYRRLPADFDVFRCNQFYFEDRYFLGKTIAGAFMNEAMVREQFFTFRKLQKNGDYNFDQMYCFLDGHAGMPSDYLKYAYPSLKSTYEHFSVFPEFQDFVTFNEIYYRKTVTSGFRMIVSGIALGYREIYLVGLDLYGAGSQYLTGSDNYGFNVKKPNALRYLPELLMNIEVPMHAKDCDLGLLDLAMKVPGVSILSISEDTPLNDYVNLAPIVNNNPMQVEDKAPDAIMDFCLLPDAPRVSKLSKIVSFFHINDEYTALKSTYLKLIVLFICKFFKDTLTILKVVFSAGFKILFVWIRRKKSKI